MDLGTNSIGWAIVEKGGTDFCLIDKGVRVFSEGVKSEKGIESSRASERTGYRSARKLKYRRKLRKYETLKVLSLNGMCPLSIEEVEAWRKSGFKEYPLDPEFLKWLRTDESENRNPYVFRDRASRQKVSLHELGRALYHLAQRRGFLSNRTDQPAESLLEGHCSRIQEIVEDLDTTAVLEDALNDYFFTAGILDERAKGGFKKDLQDGDAKLKTLYNALCLILKKNANDGAKAKEELLARLNRKQDFGSVKRAIGEISQAMKEGNHATLGQYFFSLYSKYKIRNRYAAREEHYLKEFEIVCKVQAIDGIDEKEPLPAKRYFGLAKELYNAIFFQRPLQSQKGLLGKCSFEKGKPRCAVSHPDFEDYRMWTYLGTIQYGLSSEKALRFLSEEEKLRLVPKFLRRRDSFCFEDLAKELLPKDATFGFYKSPNRNELAYWFNYKPTDMVAGCPACAALKSVVGEDWKTKTFAYITLDSNGASVSRTVDYRDLWHLLSVATSDAYLYEYAKEKLGFDEKKARAFSGIRLKKGFASLSLNAIHKILPYVKGGLGYSHAVFMANIENVVDATIWNDAAQRNSIQDRIAGLIEKHAYENGLLEAVNSLIRECKRESCYYSKEAEAIYKKDLGKKLDVFFKSNGIVAAAEQESVLNGLFPVFIEQLKAHEFIKIKRLDEKILDFLSGKNEEGEVLCSNENRLKKLYHPSDIAVFKKKIIRDAFGNERLVLGSPFTSSVKNPMVVRALHQLRKVLNSLILEGQIDTRTRIHIEMARELNDANRRKGILDYQEENRKKREAAARDIKKLYFEECKKEIEPTEDDLLRYQLWIEQNRMEIYEPTINGGASRSIRISQIVGSNPEYDIEHTIPRSLSQDNSQMNKTLCSPKFNRDIKKQKLPFELHNYELLLPFIAHWKDEAADLTAAIEVISRSLKTTSSKEARDQMMRRRHYLVLKRDYLKGKYERFLWEEPKKGFKNSQIPDTGIITKYAQAYLKSYFNRVESVKGGMVAEFRKIWGIQGNGEDKGQKNRVEKDRSSHTHHAIDAIVIACMTKEKYDMLAEAWTSEDSGKLAEARKIMAASKPWKTFQEDLKMAARGILISHYTPDNVKKQSKKSLRIRGRKQYIAAIEKDASGKTVVKLDARQKAIYVLGKDEKKIPRRQQGTTFRGSLHQDSIYGAIKSPLNNGEIRYVIRKDLESIKASDIENIVDKAAKEKVKEAIKNKVLLLSTNTQQKNKLDGRVWMNQKKEVAINKVRLYANSVKNPLAIKEHCALSRSRHEHKQKVYGQNDENYAMALYELEGKREFELINNFALSKSLREGQGDYPLYKEKEIKGRRVVFPIAKSNNRDLLLKKGRQVVFYDSKTERPKDITAIKDMKGRTYVIEGLSINRVKAGNSLYEFGVIQLRCSMEARKPDDIKKDNYKPDGDFKLGENKPTRKMSPSQFTAFVEGIDFRVLPSGRLEKI